FGYYPSQRCTKGHPKASAIGRNPTDKGKPGTKRHIVVEARGIPLSVKLTGANVHDSVVFEEMMDSIEPISRPKGQRGRPRFRPDKWHADKAYDNRRCRAALSKRGIKCRIAHK